MENRGAGLRGFVAGVLIGGIAGAALALLWAPQSGQSIRRIIREQGKEALDTLFSLVDEAGDLVERASASIPSFGDKEAKMRRRIDELRMELQALQSSSQKA